MAKRITFKRVLTYAWHSFRRNGWLSTATIVVMMLTLFVIGGLLLASVVANTVLRDLEDKIDISVAFKKGTPEETILAVRHDLEALAAVKEVTYVTPDEALAAFRERHKDDPTILASLEELGEENPLPASLNIKASRPENLRDIVAFLDRKDYPSIEQRETNEDNQKVIERLGRIISGVRNTGIAVALILGFVAVIVAFTTVQLAIYTAREEIQIMKLVGATNWYIRGPFMVEGLLHGGIAAILTSLAFLPIIWVASSKLSLFLPGIDLYRYFTENFPQFFLVLFGVGVILGVGSSFLAIRRYLKI